MIVECFAAHHWPKPPATFEKYLHEQEAGTRDVWLAFDETQFAGYVTLTQESLYPPLNKTHVPEIMDLNVLPPFRKKGIGSLLIETAEQKAFEKGDIVGIGVGLYKDYGQAQKLYIARGYQPDGFGVTYNYQFIEPGAMVCLDDDLVLWFIKSKPKAMDDKRTYNNIGKTYDATRKADSEIVNHIIHLLVETPNGKYLDIACGSGNYTGALAAKGLDIEGIDISEEMLNKARKKHPMIKFSQGDALKLPFRDASFDGATCMLATHHINNNKKLFQEAFRVLNKGYFVIFTATPEQMEKYWLFHYFPIMIKRSMDKMVNFKDMKQLLEAAGFHAVKEVRFFVTNKLEDLFLQSGKYRPEIYLEPDVRNGISSFHLSIDSEELQEGLQKLSSDIESGAIKNIIDQYESNRGDYSFIIGKK